jgi:hypothetical protein
MIAFRWLVLRIFFTLLSLPFVAFAVLWFIHEVVLPGEFFSDAPAVAFIGAALFAGVDGIVRRYGRTRHHYLQEKMQRALAANDHEALDAVFHLTKDLLAAGLLSPKTTATRQRDARRQFLTLFQRNLDSPEALRQLREAWRDGSPRREEIFASLKNYLLAQSTLTSELIDLAEELLEHHPDDAQLEDHLVRKFVENKASHHRAEYFYGRHLAAGGQRSREIVGLCLDKLLANQRSDDFALWVYVRAFGAGYSENRVLRRLLYLANQANQKIDRADPLAQEIHRIAASFFANEFAGAQIAPKPTRLPFYVVWRQGLLRGWSTIRRNAHELWLLVWPRLVQTYRRYPRYFLGGLVALVVAASFWLVLSKNQASPPETAANEDVAGYFALQVGAWKKSRSADQEKARLQQAGLSVRVLEPRSRTGWYRIHVGKYRTRQAAQVAADSLKRRGVIEDYFVSEYSLH